MWKLAFIILEGLFELTVMFFGFTNSLAMFQAMMNKLLGDLINMGQIMSFIDNMLVGTKSKEGCNELVEEVLIRIEVNYLYVKPTKYKQKVKEVGFLEVVMGPDRIKIEEEKVKVVLDQPVPKIIKKVQKFLELVNYYRQFMKNFAKITRLLHKLNRKEQK